MTGKTHLYKGGFIGTIIIVFFTYFTLVDPEPCLAFLFGTAVGSIAPDIDHPHSTISKKLGVIPGIIIQHFFGHRGAIHSLVFGAGISTLAILIDLFFGLGFFIGWTSHLLLDMFTPSGVAILWPFRQKTYTILPELTFKIRKQYFKRQYKKRRKPLS